MTPTRLVSSRWRITRKFCIMHVKDTLPFCQRWKCHHIPTQRFRAWRRDIGGLRRRVISRLPGNTASSNLMILRSITDPTPCGEHASTHVWHLLTHSSLMWWTLLWTCTRYAWVKKVSVLERTSDRPSDIGPVHRNSCIWTFAVECGKFYKKQTKTEKTQKQILRRCSFWSQSY